MRALFAFVITILILSNSPAISQGLQSPCSKPFIKIAKVSDNYIAPSTSCVTPDVAEKFKDLGWRIVPQGANVFHILDQEELDDQTVLEAAEEVFEEIGDVGEAIEELTEEVIEGVVEEVDETIEETVEEVSEAVEEAIEETEEVFEEINETVDETLPLLDVEQNEN